MACLEINSRDCSATSISSSNFEYVLPEAIEAKSFEISSVIIPESRYNITVDNNQFIFATTGLANLVTLTPGKYTISNLMNALQNAMNRAVNSNSFRVTYDEITLKVTITYSAWSGAYFSINSAGTLNYLLGFSIGQKLSDSNTYTGAQILRLDQVTPMYLNIKEICTLASNQPICIPISDKVKEYKPIILSDAAKFKTFTIRITDGTGKDIHFNGGEVIIVLLYHPGNNYYGWPNYKIANTPPTTNPSV
jgi:hypothetical protein